MTDPGGAADPGADDAQQVDREKVAFLVLGIVLGLA
jgi:hypothetical protein